MTDDRVASALAEIKAQLWLRDRMGAAAYRQSDEAARVVPRLVAAVETALSYHRQVAPQFGRACLTCGRPWPCAQYKAITTALTGGTGK